MKKSILSFLFLTTTLFAVSQVIPSSIATWKNDAQGAYSIIHDDYGNSSVDGIWQYADTIAYNRGLKFTFGAITKDCEETRWTGGYSTPYGYAKNVMMAQHNHEIINHSHHHNCAVARGWGECATTGWGELPASSDWNDNLIVSNSSIETNTGHHPRYYIYPYDQFTDAANQQLESMGYLGSRTGWSVDGIHAPYHMWGYEHSDDHDFFPNSNGFFRTGVHVFNDVHTSMTQQQQTDTLNYYINYAINNNKWANRELHNVGPAGGWGSVKEESYRQHLNYAKQKVETGELWMGTVSEILTYQYQKLVSTPTANYDDFSKSVTVSFNFNHSSYTPNLSDYLDHLTIKTPVTIKIDISSISSDIDFNNITVTQNSNSITDYSLVGNYLLVNVYPHDGEVLIEEDINVSNSSILFETELKFYPNPTSNRVSISGGRAWKVEIFDTKGSIVSTKETNTFDISHLENGVYYIRVNEGKTMQRLLKI